MKYETFYSFLVNEFDSRKAQKRYYSLRKFADDLQLDNSRLSKVMRGERPLSEKLITHICDQLSIEAEQKSFFLQQVSKSKEQGLGSYNSIDKEIFKIISDYKHYLLLELMKFKDFKNNPDWIADKMQVEPEKVQEIVERLKLAKLLVEKDTKLIDLTRGHSTHIIDDHCTTETHQATQKQVLELAAQSLYTVPVTHRDQSSMMMATSYEKVDGAKKKIKKFRRNLCRYLENTKSKNAVFQLSISLYPITKVEGSPE